MRAIYECHLALCPKQNRAERKKRCNNENDDTGGEEAAFAFLAHDVPLVLKRSCNERGVVAAEAE
jgi:hypothetical protein